MLSKNSETESFGGVFEIHTLIVGLMESLDICDTICCGVFLC